MSFEPLNPINKMFNDRRIGGKKMGIQSTPFPDKGYNYPGRNASKNNKGWKHTESSKDPFTKPPKPNSGPHDEPHKGWQGGVAPKKPKGPKPAPTSAAKKVK